LELAEGSIGLTATDGKRMAHARAPSESGTGQGSAVIPDLAIDIMREASDKVTITISPNRMTADWGRTRLQSRLIAGQYPDWRRLTTIPPTKAAIINREELLFAMRQLADVGIYCGLRIEEGSVFIWGAGKHGQASMSLECSSTVRETIFLVCEQMVEFLKTMTSETVNIKWDRARGPVRLVDFDRIDDVYITMGCVPIPEPVAELIEAETDLAA
jgi:DNA polymerase III sliding clamp (beta) subunit (PCNA family)